MSKTLLIVAGVTWAAAAWAGCEFPYYPEFADVRPRGAIIA